MRHSEAQTEKQGRWLRIPWWILWLIMNQITKLSWSLESTVWNGKRLILRLNLVSTLTVKTDYLMVDVALFGSGSV